MATSLPLPAFFPSPPPPRPRWLGISHRGRSLRVGGSGKVRACGGELQPLYDDGYGNVRGIGDYLDAMMDVVEFDHGPLRWFCPVDCGAPVKDSPLLLFLPGVDGNGMGLFMHHKALGKLFEVRCMHIPASDRTPFEGLVNFVEDVLRNERSSSKNGPIYVIGHSFGACLALSVAARNPNIDLVLVSSNPATSFHKSQLQPLIPAFRSSFCQLSMVFPFLLGFKVDNQIKMALESIISADDPLQTLSELSGNLLSPLLRISNLLDHMPREIIPWKLKLLESAASYANSRLHAVKAEVLVLASGLDRILPSRDEAERLGKTLLNCKVYYFDSHGHCLLSENDVHLSSIIKGAGLYRHSRQRNHIFDYVPPTMTELEAAEKGCRSLYLLTSPVMLSTMEDGKIVRGLSGVPNDGPVLLVGNHMLLALDIIPLVVEFLKEKRIVIRGMGHPVIFHRQTQSSSEGHSFFDFVRSFGAVPVSPRNFYNILSEKASILLYPGGSREALHRKGELYKLFWPSEPEFVRMAAHFGATIVPFGAVGEDDLGELVLDYNDMMRIPFLKEMIKQINEELKTRNDAFGEIRAQDFVMPLLQPKLPGRFYYLFGKPIITRGKKRLIKDREAANDVYLHIKSEIESLIAYLLEKRKTDKYRSVFQRSRYWTTWGSIHEIPTFEP